MPDYASTKRSRNGRILMTACALGAMAAASQAHAAGTRAGTVIQNTASASYDTGGGTTTVDSNVQEIRVDELLNVVVASSDPGDVVTVPGATGRVLTYLVTNTGNGSEAFVLTAVSTVAGDNFDPTVTQIVIDSNGNGTFDPGVDTVYVPGAGDPVLDPDASVTIFVINSIPGGVSDTNRGIVRLEAAAKTGTGAPGTSFAGAGEGGGNAVVGFTGAQGQDTGAFIIASASVALVKTAVIADPFGGTEAVPGATITYTITATISGSGSVNSLTLTDNVPATTTFVPGSITIGGVAQTDAVDGDAGSFATGTVTATLGTVAGGQTRTLSFRATVD